MFYSFTDYSTSGPNPLSFTRYYNSRDTFSAFLGVNWHSTFDRFIWLYSSSQVAIQRPDGQTLLFNLNGGIWTPDADVDYTLTNTGAVWTLTTPDDSVEIYTAATTGYAAGNQALLQTIQQRNGYLQSATYNSNNILQSVTDSYGRTLSLIYNADGTLASIATPDSTSISYGYTTAGGTQNLTSVTYSTSPASKIGYVYANSAPTLMNALTGVLDDSGNSIYSWTYDAYGRALTSQTGNETNANITTVAYNDTTGERTVTNALGVADTYTFATSQNMQKVTSISRSATSTTAAAAKSYSYDSNGYVASMTDWDGNLTTFVNNAHGLPTAISQAVDSVSSVARNTTITYNSVWTRLPSSIVTDGLTASFTYDGNGEQLTKTLTDTTTSNQPYATAGQTRTWTNTWSDFLLASVQNPNGNFTEFTYDSSGALTAVADALKHTTQITSHSGGGVPVTIVDPNGVTTTLIYDGRQRLTSRQVSGSTGKYTTSWAFDPDGNLITATLPDGSFLKNEYDTAHRLTKTTDALGSYITYTLDALGDRTRTNIYKNDGTVTWSSSVIFDALGRELVSTGGAGQTTTKTYDASGNTLSVEDGLNHTTITVYDALDRASKVTDANGGTTTLAYDSHDRTIGVTDANGNTTSYLRDGFGDVIEQISPDSGTSIFHYDAEANLISKTDALGIVTNQTFDALDRPLTTTYPAHAAENVAYTYDQTGTGFSFGVGRLTSVADVAGSLTRTYEERGNLASEIRVNGTTTLNTSYTYDGASRIASMTYPDGTLVTYLHDAAGYVSSVSAQLPGSSAATNLATLTHQPFGPLNGANYGNGVGEAWTFDQSNRPTNIIDRFAGASLQNLTYGYDVANNVTSITDAVNASNSQTLGYDPLDRLTSAVSGPGGYGSFSWSYDKVGNRLEQVQGGMSTTYSYAPGTNRLASITTSTATAQMHATHTIRRQRPPPSPSAEVSSRIGPAPPALQHLSPILKPASMLVRTLGWPMLIIGFSGVAAFRKRLLHNKFLAVSTVLPLLTGSTTLLIGCSNGSALRSDALPVMRSAVTGTVYGGQQPVSGALVQLYAAGATGDSSAATPLLANPVLTNQNGGFSLTNYTCPSDTIEVYLVATGGNPGFASATNNHSIAMMAALGQCSSLASLTYVSVNEITTVGSLAALYLYASSYSSLGSGSSDAAQLIAAFSSVNEYTNIANGTVPGPMLPTGYYASSTEINTLGDVIASCINSAGGVAGDGTACGNLFALATPSGGGAPTDIIAAILDILKNPTHNVSALFNLAGATVPFQPTLSTPPANWSLPIVSAPATPAFSLQAGTYNGSQSVTVTDSTTGVLIYYTTDGTAPSISSHRYTGPITIVSTETIKAIAILSGHIASTVASATYVIGTTVGIITTFAGNGDYSFYGDGGPATSAAIFRPTGTAFDGAGNLYIADSSNNRVRVVNTSGIIVTVAGNGTAGYSGDGGPATSAALNNPFSVAVDTSNNLYIADQNNQRVRKVSAAGVISTFVGTGTAGYNGEGIAATSAQLNNPLGVAADQAGNVYISDSNNLRIRKVDTAGVISTVAGNGTVGISGDGGPAVAAQISYPAGIAVDASGNLYIADIYNNRVREVNTAGIISTLAGTGIPGYNGDGIAATSAELYYPTGVGTDAGGNIYISDEDNNRIRKVNSAGIISTVAGNGTFGYSGDGGPATNAELYNATGVSVDNGSNLYISDRNNYRVRKVTYQAAAPTFSPVAGSYSSALTVTISSATSGVSIYYTTDGTTPTVASSLYTGPITVATTETVRAIATEAGLFNSSVISATYTFSSPAAPVFSPPAGRYASPQTVTISSTTAGTSLYYTTDGTTPTAASTLYAGPISVASNETINAIAVENGLPSSVATALYVFPPPAAAPTFSLASGTYTSAQTVTLSDSTAGANIYYTVDGTTPTTASAQYSGPLTVSRSETIQAIAGSNGFPISPVASAAYGIGTISSVTSVTTNANGNITSIPPANSTANATFAYNNANRLASVTGSPIAATFIYDYAGQRYSKTDGGTPPTIFSYAAGGRLIAENSNGVVTDYIYVDGRPIATLQPRATPPANQVNYIVSDHLGTAQFASNNSGATVWQTAYQPFGTTGTINASITQNLRFPGHYADTETGFFYNVNRDYMPNLGRYLESDPFGLAGGANSYLYADADPITKIDVTGKSYTEWLFCSAVGLLYEGPAAGFVCGGLVEVGNDDSLPPPLEPGWDSLDGDPDFGLFDTSGLPPVSLRPCPLWIPASECKCRGYDPRQ